MNFLLEEKFQIALNHCQLLKEDFNRPSAHVCQALKLFCAVAEQPKQLLSLLKQYADEVQQAEDLVTNYAATIDNWSTPDCPLGIQDQCNIIHFFLNLNQEYSDLFFFRGQDFTPEVICQFLKDWQGIDLIDYLPMNAVLNRY